MVSPHILKDLEFDVVVIAILNEASAVQIKNEMVKVGIPGDKIDWVRQDILESVQLPGWVKVG